ncbi:MAG: type I-C CRISPR-associated protein Cas8c/Csd1 [Chlorobiaceae bacterium]|nr:type I-C CRISPR-associated protein Cas8c/Csd1 [Chlorobiaceae bacterium]
MSWMEELYKTYKNCLGKEPPGSERLIPIGHMIQQAHLEITIDILGTFIRAKIVKKEATLLPVTEDSAGRSGIKPPPHPLCDKVQYCAGDYSTDFGGQKPSFFEEYKKQLSEWCESEFSHPKAKAVLAYISKGRVVNDLVNGKLLHVDTAGKLLTRWTDASKSHEIFSLLTPKEGKKDQGDAFIRWNVVELENPCSAVWNDESLQKAWIEYEASVNKEEGFCMVTGEKAVLALNHPKGIRYGGDGAKLISANDSSGYTFRGRFTDDSGQQACGVSREVTQKAHNALHWLIKRQAYRNDDQVIVSWAVGGHSVPDLFCNSYDLFLGSEDTFSESNAADTVSDIGQAFALRLSKVIAGYRAQLDDTDDIIVMGLDSATPGRMAITFYRELNGSEFLQRLQSWHDQNAWLQIYSKEIHFFGAPSPQDIAEAAYGSRLDKKLRKSTVERLLPCIVDSQRIPRDLVESVFRRACNRQGLKTWDWEKTLGIACAVYRGFYNEKQYQMKLETERNTTDYLYGRLLAIADNIENYALKMAGEGRETTAARLMQRFADRPFSTWRTIELALIPYKTRLHSSEKTMGFLKNRERLLDEVMCAFCTGDYSKEKDRPLSGEFLLGYHCQRHALFSSKSSERDSSDHDSQIFNSTTDLNQGE